MGIRETRESPQLNYRGSVFFVGRLASPGEAVFSWVLYFTYSVFHFHFHFSLWTAWSPPVCFNATLGSLHVRRGSWLIYRGVPPPHQGHLGSFVGTRLNDDAEEAKERKTRNKRKQRDRRTCSTAGLL